MARCDVLKQCGGMDEEYYFYGEDSDLCYRIWQQGWKISYLPNSFKVIHHGGVSSTINLFDSSQRRKHLMGWKSRFLFVKKHYHFWRRVQIFLAVIAALCLNASLYSLASLKRRDVNYFRINMGAHVDISHAALSMFSQ